MHAHVSVPTPVLRLPLCLCLRLSVFTCFCSMHAYVSVPMPVGGIEVMHAYLSVPTPLSTCMSVPGPSLGRACGAFVCCAVWVGGWVCAPYVLCIHTSTYDTYEILIYKQYVITISGT
jgi:hypothetical protein